MLRFLNKRLLAAAALLLTATGCEKVINLPLKTSPAQLVIEANLVDNGQPAQVRLSMSVNYQETNTYPPVTGAVITLSNEILGAVGAQ